MFNRASVNQTLNINAVSGGIYKTYKESWFEHLHLNSSRSNNLLSQTGKTDYYDKGLPHIAVLQMVINGEGTVLVELIEKDDLEKYLVGEVEE